MKRFELAIHARSIRNEKRFIFHEVIEADDLVELYSKLLIMTAQVQDKIQEDSDCGLVGDDDIPF